MTAKKISFILAGLTLVVLFSIRTTGDSSNNFGFSEDRALLTGITRQAAKPEEGHLAHPGILATLPLDRDEARMEEKEEEQGGADCPSTWEVPEMEPAPEDVDLGLEQDQFVEGGELVAETVNLLNGNVLEGRLDLRFPSANRMGFPFEARYNSRSNLRGSLGFGWSHTYSAALIPPAETGQPLRITDETGKACYFSETDPGKFEGLYQERTRVARSTDRRYHWYRLDGGKMVFSATGALIDIEDPVGNRISLSYSEGRLQ